LSLFECEVKMYQLLHVYDNIGMSGSFEAVGTFYNVNGIEARRDPFFWQTNANVNISAMGVPTKTSKMMAQNQIAMMIKTINLVVTI